MSQQIFSDIDPEVTTGLMLAALLDDFKAALMSGFSGTSRPTQLLAGGLWIDTTDEGSPDYKWALNLYNGSDDLTILEVDLITGAAGFNFSSGEFTVRKISADTAGPIVSLVKSRISGSGQVLQDDLVARIRFIGRTNTGTDPLVAYLQATATEDMESGAAGVIFSMYSTPVGTNTVAEHLRFLSGITESVAAHKFNSIIWGQDTVAGSANMVLTDDKILTEVTGGSGANIHGIENDSIGSQVKIIVNSGSTNLAVKHESLTASAGQRFKLPGDTDLSIPPDGTLTAYYCTTDSRWKVMAAAGAGILPRRIELVGDYVEWVSPITGYVDVIGFPQKPPGTGPQLVPQVLEDNGWAFVWGGNSYGRLGLSDTAARSSPVIFPMSRSFHTISVGSDATASYGLGTDGILYSWGENAVPGGGHRSSPVAVLGGLSFVKAVVSKDASHALQATGSLYAWGTNANGQLGVGDVADRSSPVLVLGGLLLSGFYSNGSSVFGRAADGSLYAWGLNTNGQLGVGDVTPRSSPVAVLGGLTDTFIGIHQAASSVFAIDVDGTPYSWGVNTNGQLGVGDVAARSSPVAVLGGLAFREIYGHGSSIYGRTEDGYLYAWGENTYGQLGVGDVAARSSPVAVLGGKKFSKVVALENAVVAIDSAGDAYAWGRGLNGTLGTADVTDRSSPVAVVGGFKFVNLSAIYPSAILAQELIRGTIYSWGLNTSGELGDASVTNRSSPVVVQGLSGYRLDKSDLTSYLKVLVTSGETYKIYMGAGAARFGGLDIGNNIGRVVLAYFG